MILLHPHKVLIKIIMKKILNQMIKTKRRAMIKGEMSMMGIKEEHHHIQECHNVQRDHPVDNILGDIEKGVTTSSRVANFCEHYSFVSSFEPFKVEDTLHYLEWAVAMQ
jgi:hypothetical protein